MNKPVIALLGAISLSLILAGCIASGNSVNLCKAAADLELANAASANPTLASYRFLESGIFKTDFDCVTRMTSQQGLLPLDDCGFAGTDIQYAVYSVEGKAKDGSIGLTTLMVVCDNLGNIQPISNRFIAALGSAGGATIVPSPTKTPGDLNLSNQRLLLLKPA